MRILSILQHKGGVGKTTSARILAEYFARKGKGVLGIDLDGQASFSKRFIDMDYDQTTEDLAVPPLIEINNQLVRVSSADIFIDGVGISPLSTKLETLEIIPSFGERLRAIEKMRYQRTDNEIYEKLQNFLDDDTVKQRYDLVIIDTAPAKGPLTIAALRASSHILVPIVPEYQSLEGLQGMLQMWRKHNRSRTVDNPIRMIGILPNKYRNVTLHNAIIESIKSDEALSALLIPAVLSERIAFAEVDHPGARPISLFDYADSDKAKEEALTVCEYVEKALHL